MANNCDMRHPRLSRVIGQLANNWRTVSLVATTSSTPTRRKSPEARRLEILEAAGGIALTEGLEAITFRRVADRLGCAPGLIHHYFPVVIDLVAEALDDVLMTDQDDSFDEAEAEPDALAGLSTLLTRWTFHKANEFSYLWLDAWSLARRHSPVRLVVDDVMKRGHVRLTALLDTGVQQGCFTAEDTQSVAWYLLTALDGLIVHTSVGVNQGLVDVTRTVATFTEQELGLPGGSLRIAQSTQ
jgi:AcrR family transcriptional regulator